MIKKNPVTVGALLLLSAFSLFSACGPDGPTPSSPEAAELSLSSASSDATAQAPNPMAHYLFNTNVVWTQPSTAAGFDPEEPYTPVAHVNNSTYLIWIDSAYRPWLTQVTNGIATVVPLDKNEDYTVQPDGHHRFSLGVDKDGYIHVTGDMHHYSTYSDGAVNPYPARYQRQKILYWKSNQPYDVTGGFTFAGGKGSASAIPGGGWMMGRFFTDNNNELFYSSMTHAYEAPSVRNRGQMAVGLYRYVSETKTWSAIGGRAELPNDPYLTNVEDVFYWEGSGMGGGWFQNYQARFQFDANNRLHFTVSGNTNSQYSGADRVFYAVSADGGVTWKKASGAAISKLPLRGIDGVAGTADVVADSGAASNFYPKVGLAVDKNGNVAVSAGDGARKGSAWYVWDGTRWSISERMSAPLPWGVPQLAYRDPSHNLIFASGSPGILLRAAAFDQPFFAYEYENQKTGNVATPDEGALRKSGVFFGLFSPGRDIPPSIIKTAMAPAPLPSGWSDLDLTKRANPYYTSTAFSDGTFNLYDFGTGTGQFDDLHFTSTALKCDGTLTARFVKNSLPVPGAAEAGIMMRESVAGDARLVKIGAVPSQNRFSYGFRSNVGDWINETNIAAGQGPSYLKLQREGSQITASVSADGATWTKVGQTTLNVTGSLAVGLYSAAKQHGYYMQAATFDKVSVASACEPPPDLCVRKAATIAISPSSQSMRRRENRSYNVVVTNNDSTACGYSVFGQSLSVKAPFGNLSMTLANYNLLIAPGATASTTLTVTATAKATRRSYLIKDSLLNRTDGGSLPVVGTAKVEVIY